jgi:hypothetical protein
MPSDDSPEPKTLDLLMKSEAHKLELEKETEWTRVYKTGPKSYYLHSKFQDKGFQVAASEIRQRWPGMSERERVDFAQSLGSKRDWTDNETEILEIIMQDGTDVVWHSVGSTFLRHPNRAKIIDFLIERLRNHDLDHEPLNYIRVLGISKESRAAAAIRPYYEKCKEAIQAESEIGIIEDVVFGPIPYSAFFQTCAALMKTDRSPEYEEDIRKYLNHPNEQVRWWAEYALEIEGPTSTKRNQEHRDKYIGH